ncbi:spermidine coumaroyl-CoA acyltransferase-like [Impatiens glandulifera]|uniref:spermidine coumaroyl-CoA acyltransferase-like n=1 Tax=Impatiens glandulifera TaxID=253017 RepID=UPI001FB0651B|nr:spermidine coumaroyl-CoA acyltransferase-like [Impatiens glandulifera]
MANNDQAFVVDKKDIFLVKPSKPTPSCVLSFSSIDNYYIFEFLVYTIHVYKASHNQENNLHDDPACLIKDALSRVLVYYYPMAGKLKRNIDGKLRITCNADGVPFVEAIASCSLSSLNYLDGVDLQTAREFVVNYPNQSELGYHPLVVQVTKFSCGGFAVGMGLSHAMCDGVSASQFLRALAGLVKGKNEPVIKPVWERELLVVEPNCEESIQLSFQKTTLANSPYLPTIDLLHEFFNISGETIEKMRSSLIIKGDDIDIGVMRNNFTSLEIISAYIWRSMFRALDLNSDGDTVLIIINGIRHILKNPTLPQGYYGNSIVFANSEMSGKQLNEGPFLEIVETIKEGKKSASNPDYICKAISIFESITRAKSVYRNNGACVYLTDWRHLGFMEVDFGFGEPVNLMVLPLSESFYQGTCLFLPSSKLDAKMKGGMRVYLTLPRVAMTKMRAEMDAIEQMDYIK